MIMANVERGQGERRVKGFSILDHVSSAMQIVVSQYPGSQLYQVDGVFLPEVTPEPALGIDCLELLFRTKAGGIARVTATQLRGWGPIQYMPYPWLEDRVIPWPISMDLADAIALMRKAGYEADCKTMALRWPLFPGVLEPFYIFGLANQTFIFVGVYTRSVMVHP